MSVSIGFSVVVHRAWTLRAAVLDFLRKRLQERGRFSMLTLPFLVAFLLTACSGLSFGGSGNITPTPTASSSVALSQLHWCGKPLQLFRDEGATAAATTGTPSVTPTTVTTTATPGTGSTTTPTAGTPTPTTLTDWSRVQPKLGFTVYLPASLPRNTCLTSASGTINDPIFGGSFSIGYLLPDHSAITLSEAPARSQNSSFQCSTSVQGTIGGSTKPGTATVTASTSTAPLQVCTGVRDATNIVFSAHGTQTKLEQFFNALQPNVVWVPHA